VFSGVTAEPLDFWQANFLMRSLARRVLNRRPYELALAGRLTGWRLAVIFAAWLNALEFQAWPD